MSRSSASAAIATLGIDLGKNSFHLIAQDQRGAIVLRIELSRSQLTQRLANIPPCLIGMEAYAGAHYIGRQLRALGHDVRLIPAQYVKPFLKGHKNDHRDAEAITAAVQRPTMSFVAIKTPEQMDLLALHRVRSRLVSQRTGVTNQIWACCSSAASPCAKGSCHYVRRCQASWVRPLTPCHRGWFASSSTWLRIGTGSTSASPRSRLRSRRWRYRTITANA
jgi:hypothetical protein